MTFQEIKDILKNKTVGLAGCGGLGSNCAVALARVGIGNIIIADFDKIELSNLNRQYYFYNQIGLFKADALKDNIKIINPFTNVISHNIKLNNNNITEIFAQCDVIVEAFDKSEMKAMILKTVTMFMPNKYLVMGLGMAGWGKSNILTQKTYDKLIICGDESIEIADNCPPLAPRVGIVANMQANAVLEILLK